VKYEKKLKELEKIKQVQNQQPQSQSQSPLDQLKRQLGDIEQDVRKQQLDTETSLQSNLSQVASEIGNIQAINNLMQAVNGLSSLAQNQGLQGSAGEYHQLLSQLGNDLRQQIQAGTLEAVQSLQQGINALAQANTALMDNNNYHQLLHYVNLSELFLVNWETTGETKVH